MRVRYSSLLAGTLVLITLTACAPTLTDLAGGDPEMRSLMLSSADADGWLVSPDDGPVDGGAPDCTGAPYDWPDMTLEAHAAQFLDRPNESISVVMKRYDGFAAVIVEALRGALAPCAPNSGPVKEHGAMIDLLGDDSFAYQSSGSNDLGDFSFSNMLVTCGNLMLQVSSMSYTSQLDQPELERLVAPLVMRMSEDQRCA